ncbi:DUF4349 domain-containing protein [Mucilaginibacter auburnensis]|uniref:Uncharacterized protein DUF4349 n=1 Tax=Mucilaginibacter auburnensis TaxID=1457233 RepID=A0A2H9VNA4_9SPHI|nr:DUF4349 domain-containing protein [Mucilaginibacter auburnensis]PJJ79806.1 uncharacterized protein DUF4349 [Mucilaginibacter auburnensis]
MKAKLLVMLAGIAMLAACQGYQERASSDIDSLVQDTVLVKTADMRLKVKNLQQAAEKVTKLVANNKGMVMHHDMQAEVLSRREIPLSDDSIKRLTVMNVNADMTVRMPSEKIEAFMDSLNHLSVYVDRRTMDIEDRTLEHVAGILKAENREENVKLRKKIKPSHTGADSILATADNVVDRKIDTYRMEADAAMSTVKLNIYENNVVQAEVVANEDLSAYSLPLLKRAGMALSTGWFYFTQLIVVLLHIWPFLLSASAVGVAIITYKKRKAAKVSI